MRVSCGASSKTEGMVNMIKKIAGKNTESILALTPMQQGLLFHYMKDPRGESYINQLDLEAAGEIDWQCFEKSWNLVIETNPVLRSVFRWEKLEKPIQVVLKNHPLQMKYIDLTTVGDREEQNRRWKTIKQQDRESQFDLRQVPFRVILGKMAPTHYHILISNHHILYDGWSTGIILKEFFQAYEILAKGEQPPLVPVKSALKEFIHWHRQQDKEEQKKFWQSYLEGIETPTRLPVKQLKPAPGSPGEFNYRLHLPGTLKDRLEVLVKEKRLSLAAVFYSAWGLLLQKYCGMEDVLFGITVSGRSVPVKGIENMVGLFINTIPLRARNEPGESMREFLERINHHLAASKKYENTPLIDIYRCSQQLTWTGEELFDTLVSMENYPLDGYLREPGARLAIQSYTMEEKPHYDLTLAIFAAESMHIDFIYKNTSLDKETIVRLAHHYRTILKSIGENVENRPQQIQLLSGEEKQRLLEEFNSKRGAYPVEKTIHELYEQQAEQRPGGTALLNNWQLTPGKKEKMHITYGKLNETTGQLATLLRERGVRPDTFVGIMAERSGEMITGILGILKAGGAYVPLPFSPGPLGVRTKYMLAECGVKILLAAPAHREKVEAGVIDIRTCTCTRTRTLAARRASQGTGVLHHPIITREPSPRQGAVSPANLAYVVFTSGSTGKPKGVSITHANLSPLLHWGYRQLALGPADRTLQNLAYYFDWSVWEIFITLTSGACLLSESDEILLDPEACITFMEKMDITVLHATPTQYNYLLRPRRQMKTLKYLCLGAEKLSHELARRAIALINRDCRVYNMYGPTECTIIASTLEFQSSDLNAFAGLTGIPIGLPTGNAGLLVLDKYMQPCPLQVAGELYIAGDGTAAGYLNNPELTAERFIDISLDHKQLTIKARLYRTGDIARRLPDGNVEYLGREDFQVKVRGFRIELGEIENCLIKHPGVKEALVAAHKDKQGEMTLCAYIVGSAALEELPGYLTGVLPAYMVPTYFDKINAIPLTPSGKINRKALPLPEMKSLKEYIKPRNEMEKKLAGIWAEVLNREQKKIGRNDNFFEMGGHSLKATALVSRIHKDINVKLPIQMIFKNPRLGDQAECIEKFIKNSHPQVHDHGHSPIEPVEKKEYYPLSPAQKRLYILQQFTEGNTSYNMPYILPLEQPAAGDNPEEKLEIVFKTLIARHESLRTSFAEVKEKPVQRIHDTVEFEIKIHRQEKWQEEEAIIEHLLKPFDLSRAPLLRVELIKTGAGGLKLFVDMHHIITDGTSQHILRNEFITLNRDPRAGLSKQRLQYRDYTHWVNHPRRQDSREQQKNYWQRIYPPGEELPVLNLPTDHPRPLVQSIEGNWVHFALGPRETGILKTIARENDVTLFMCLLAVFNLLFSKLSGQEDIILGVPIAARRHSDLDRVMGMMVNTLVMRNYPCAGKTLVQYLKEIKQQTLEAYENQEYPFEELVEHIRVNRDTGRNPLFDIMLNLLSQWENHPENLDLAGAEHPPYRHRKGASRFDMTFSAFELEEHILFHLEYSTKLYKPVTIDRYIRYLKTMVHSLPGNTRQKLAEIEMLSKEEKKEILRISSGLEEKFPAPATIHRLYERQTETTPNHIAVVGHERLPRQVTYRELNHRANQLAHLLREKGVGTDGVVGIILERSVEMIFGILGILKAGAAYLPIDIDYPRERISRVLADSGAGVVLTREILQSEEAAGTLAGYPCCNPVNNVQPGNLLYIIYTSGSTGTPKGVILEHGNLINLIQYQYRHTQIDFSRVLQFTTISFDVSAQEIFSTLLAGGRLTLVNKETLPEVPELFKWVERNQIKTLFLPASFLKFVINEESFIQMLSSSIDHIVTAGEQVVVNQRFKRYLKEKQVYFHNHYGPSEAHVVTAFTMGPSGGIPELPPIGRPVANTQIYILHKQYQPVPLGVPGEIFIGGSQVGRGYLNNPALTADKFHRFYRSYKSYGSYISKRVYRTGDLGRWLLDGNIEFLGRMDHQVKIRGYRVELGEIESRLLNYPGVKEVVVLLRTPPEETKDKYLCAYIVPIGEISREEMREYLSTDLPGYMIPTHFIFLERIPLTPNGKTDRKLLPAPGIQEQGAAAAPGDNTEKKLQDIWAGVLGIEKGKIGIHDNFFHLGGHSLKATILAARIHKELAVKIPLAEIFMTPFIRGLAAYVKKAGKQKFFSIKPVEKKEYYILSSAQRRLFVLQQMDEQGIGYNMSSTWQVEGNLEKEKLEAVFQQLIRRHESLRTSFQVVNDEPVQRIKEKVEVEVEEIEGTRGLAPLPLESANSLIGSFIRPFDLSQAPLLRVGLIKIHKQTYILMVDMHHIISDGLSTGIIVKEFTELYGGKNLPGIRLQYKDCGEWHNRRETRELIKEQETYWLKQFAREVPVLNIPTDYLRPSVWDFAGRTLQFEMTKEETASLKSLARDRDITLFMLLLSLYTIFLNKLTGQEDIVVGTPIAGRRHADLEAIVGMFVNTLALKNTPSGKKKVNSFLEEVKENTINAFANQDYQYEDLVEKVMHHRDASRNPLFDTMFILQNLEIPTMEIPGLKLKPYTYEHTTAKFDITLICTEIADHLSCTFEYNTTLFKEETIHRYVKYTKKLLSSAPRDPAQPIFQIDMLPEKEKKQLIEEFNDTAGEFPGDKTIYQLFEEQVDRHPDCAALVFDHQTVTYRDFDRWANQLARYLLTRQGIRAGHRVAVLMERSIELIMVLMAVMKARAAYVPLDITQPGPRLALVFKDASIGAAITQQKYRQKLTPLQTGIDRPYTILCIENLQKPMARCTDARPPAGNPGDPAYVMYTSGSSGIPKGVLVEHRTIVNTITWRKNNYEYAPGHASLQIPPYFFDSSVTDIFTPLLGGARLVLVKEEERTQLTALRRIITSHLISHFIVVPVFYNVMLEEMGAELKHIKMICCAGENFPDELIKKHFQRLPRVRIFNEYGPTENSVNTTAYELKPHSPRAFIGKPISNVRVYILGKNLTLCPIAVTGELCLAGSSLARGYLNRPGLTAEKFINRYNRSNTSNTSYIFERIYKTGDLGRWLPEGNLEFLGRTDNQVKIRGIRVEIGEIQNQLMKHDQIKEAVVRVRQDENGDNYLCAYLVPHRRNRHSLQPGQIKDYLSQRLPAYMIPAYIRELEQLPLTPNGKLDVKALPTPQPDEHRPYRAPRNQIEKKMVEIWKSVLGKDHIGINDHFFYMGGDSIKSIQIMSRLNRAGYKLEMKDIFQYPVISELAPHVKKLQRNPDQNPVTGAIPLTPIQAEFSGNIQTRLEQIIDICAAKEDIEPTPGDFTYKGLSIESLEQLQALYPDIEDIYPLTPMQAGMLFHSLLDETPGAYFQQTSFRMQGEIDIALVEKSLNQLVKRHAVLRTAFVHKEIQRPLQVVLKTRPVELYYRDISHISAARQKDNLVREYKDNDKNRAFDLSKDILVRVSIFRLEQSEYIFTWSFHHILMDGWCNGIITSEFFQVYTANRENRPDPLPVIKPYRTYIQWLEKQDREESGRYWQNYLDGFEQPTGIPNKKIEKKEKQGYLNKKFSIQLSVEKTRALKQLAARHHVTLNIVNQTAWGILLGKYNGREDVVFGAVVSGRPYELAGVESMVGLFINTIPVRIRCHEKMKFYQLLQKVQAEAVAGEAYHYHPLADIQTRTPLKQNLIDHLFAFENYPIAEQIEGYGRERNNHAQASLSFKLTEVQVFEQTNYDLNVMLEGTRRLRITFQYNGHVAADDDVKRLVHHYQVVLDQVLENREIEIGRITFLSAEEKNRLLYEINETSAPYPAEKTLQQLFTEQAEKTPDHTALLGPEHRDRQSSYRSHRSYMSYISITYRHLNQKSHELAGLLKQKGVGADTIVGIMVERSNEMVIGIFAILKAGGAYLPIDPGGPPERIDYMLKDSGAKILLTGQEIANLYSPQAFNNRPKGTPSHLHPSPAPATSLAYVIYTSGSTGWPKGVAVEHTQVVNFVYHMYNRYEGEVGVNDRCLGITSIMFDVSVWEFFLPLTFGAGLILLPEQYRFDAQILAETIVREQITLIYLPPALLEDICQRLKARQGRQSLNKMLVGVEPIRDEVLEGYMQLNPRMKIINGYGPTETTVCASSYNYEAHPPRGEIVPIGKPLSNNQILLLDSGDNIVPPGIPGEICISGDGVTRGYLNQPQLTAEKFDHDLWDYQGHQDGNHRSNRSYKSYILYRTGDLARWLEDGNIRFLGRKDQQVKIRGYRIELGEIENQLKTHPQIKEAVVMDRNDRGRKYLCAYYTTVSNRGGGRASQQEIIAVRQLKEYLEGKLPGYMVPACYVKLERIPLNVSGKIDRRQLPPPLEWETRDSSTYLAPVTEIQRAVVQIWQEILGRENIGIRDNFFHLGGNSLDLVAVSNQLREKLGKEVPVAVLFTQPVIEDLARYLTAVQLPGTSITVPGNFVLLNGTPQSTGNIFFVHEILGDVGAYMEFCKQLGTRYNCWGVEAEKLRNYAPRHVTIEEISAKYLQQVKSVQPRGPYSLATWSWGGHLGLEMALQLEKMGEKLSLLAFVDCLGPDYRENNSPPQFTLENEKKFLEKFFTATGNQAELEKINDMEQLWIRAVDILTGNVALVEEVRKLLNQNALVLPDYDELGGEELIQYLNIHRIHANASARYIPVGKIQTPIHYFRANQNLERVENWKDYCCHPVVYHEINGDHHSIFRDKEQIADFARLFKEAVSQAWDNAAKNKK
jgi:amino acid adenylation domain-containing protein